MMSLDEATNVEPLITAAHLARELAAFVVPGMEKLRLPPDVRRSPLLHYRYLGVAALVRAFDLGEVADVLTGRFVAKRPLEAYAGVITRIREQTHDPGAEIGIWQIEFLFSDLLRFRARAMLDSPFIGAIELEHAYGHYGHALTESVVAPLSERLLVIDQVLAAILDPEGRSFSMHDLVEGFGHPDVELAV
jgi:hypothetical protein